MRGGIIPAALAPLVLSGCALQAPAPSTPAQTLVTTLIAEQVPDIQRAQAELAQVSALRLTPASSPISHSPGPGVLTPTHPALASARSRPGTIVPSMQAVRYTGSPAGVPSLARNGQAATLRQTVTRIVPAGWQQHYAADLMPDKRQPQRWGGDDQWPHVLNTTLHAQGLVALIDWTDQRVSITRAAGVFTRQSASPPALFRPPLPGKTPTRAPPTVWQITAGSTLKDALFSWAATARCEAPGVTNWTVAWVTPVNYRVDAPLHFTGHFRDALNGLFTLYGTAKVPLYAGLREAQCIVTVDDKEPR